MSGKRNFLDNIASELVSWASSVTPGFRIGKSFINPAIVSTSKRKKGHSSKREKQKASPTPSEPDDSRQQSYNFSPTFVNVIPLIDVSHTHSQLNPSVDPLDFCNSDSDQNNIEADSWSIANEELPPHGVGYESDEDGNGTGNEQDTGPGLTFVKRDLDVEGVDDFLVKEENDVENEKVSSAKHSRSKSNRTRLKESLENYTRRKDKPKQLTKTKRNGQRQRPCVKYENQSEDEDGKFLPNSVAVTPSSKPPSSHKETVIRTSLFRGYSDGPNLFSTSQLDEESEVVSISGSTTHCPKQLFDGTDDSELSDFKIYMDSDDDNCQRQLFDGTDDSELGDFKIYMDPYDDDDSSPHSNSSDDDGEALASLQKFMQSTDTSFLRRKREDIQNSEFEVADIKDIKLELDEENGFQELESSHSQEPNCDITIKYEREVKTEPDENEDFSLSNIESAYTISSVKSESDSSFENHSQKQTDKSNKLSNQSSSRSELKNLKSVVKSSHKKAKTQFDKDVDLDNADPPILKRIAKNALSKRRRVRIYDQEITRVINRRTGTLKTRYRPPRPRDYSYRKLEWKCPLCSKRMKYGSRFLHQQKKHPQRYICPACPFNTRSRKKLQRHIKRKHGGGKRPQKYRCRTCSKNFCYKSTLEHHMELIHKKKPFSVTCILCKDVFSSTNELGSHYRTKHKKNADPNTKPFKCKDCDKAYYSTGALSLHIKAVHDNDKPFKCDKCDFSSVRKDKLRDHFVTHQRSKKPHSSSVTVNYRRCLHIIPTLRRNISLLLCEYCGYVCEGCSLVFLTQRFFSNHTHKNFCHTCFIKFPHEKVYNLHTAYHQPPEEILHRCQLCKFGFKKIQYLNIHASKVHGILLKDDSTNYDCKVCGKSFKTKLLLLIHAREHDTSKHHGCYFCKNTFITVTLRDFHLHRYHTMERSFSCPSCGKSFLRNTDLIRHKKSHSKESGLFKCEICDRKFLSKRNLGLHLQTHEKRTFYSCEVCKKSFLDQNYLRLHKKVHSTNEEKPWPCHECDKGYMKKQGLDEHMVSAHQAPPQIFCKKCGQSFATGKGLVNHLANNRCAKSRDWGHNVSNKKLLSILAQKEAIMLSSKVNNGTDA